jgi:hypothetical protein
MKSTKYFYIIITFLSPVLLQSQNYVNNPGFEQYTELNCGEDKWATVVAWEKPDKKFSIKNGLSFFIGVHNNFYFQRHSQIDTSCIGTGSCVILHSMGIHNISPVIGCDFGIKYYISVKNKFSVTPSLSYSNRRIKFKADSLTLINNLNSYPVKYRDVLHYDISPHCLDLGLFFEYRFFKNLFTISGGLKYTFATFLQKKLTHFEGVESREKDAYFFNNRLQRHDFPPRSVSVFHPSILLTINCNGKDDNTIVKPFIGIEMENKHFYYFQFGIEVPLKTTSQLFIKNQTVI